MRVLGIIAPCGARFHHFRIGDCYAFSWVTRAVAFTIVSSVTGWTFNPLLVAFIVGPFVAVLRAVLAMMFVLPPALVLHR